jgi:hypothetical protein
LELIEGRLYLELVAGTEVMKIGQQDLVGKLNQEKTSVSQIGTLQSCVRSRKTCISLSQW